MRSMVGTDIEVKIEELSDGRYIAYAVFASGDVENVVTAAEDCRSTRAVFEECGELLVESGYAVITIERKGRAS